ncbi:outer membrane beta-barrel protein [Paraburkholderia sp. MMS20-SJTN17]|uniref:Outer membrane beta-barrel protein n=1 Tax=Paraburkholderia translucens TaxID=2886945 RepID=A0ABS8KJW3_9BURK|nr:OmpW family outer membrane protein [Paraburkholderia sp. MMS20-SJTN17]MCC8405066.1 outer membrane beta-barrel protein [Paraburkholderia sp. MMS20-SJTN17]
MKLKQAVTGMAVLACMSTAAHAQSAGTFFFSTGWFHLAPQSSSDPLTVTSIGGSPTNITEANTGASLSSADTIGFTGGYFITDHIATEFVIGVPPTFDLEGSGSLEQFGKLGQAKQWSPTLLFKYYFNAPTASFRPYLGLGVSRVSFTDAKITNSNFEANVLHGPTSVSTDSSWVPVFNAGFTYAFDQHWFAGVSISYLPLSTTAKLNSTSTTVVGTLNIQSQTKIKLNPIVTYANVGYRF